MINPTIFWSQNEYVLKIRISVENPFKPPIVSFDEKNLKLLPEAFNIEEVDTLYKLQFFDSVVPDRSYFRIGVNEIIYDILKSQPKNWPRLLKTMDYCPFLQEEMLPDDYSWILNENDHLYDDSLQGSQKSMQNSFRRVRANKNFGRRKKQSITPEEIKKVYLFLYNLFQFVGFTYILVVLSIRYAKEGAASTIESYKALGLVIKLLYLTQIQEVILSIAKNGRGSQLLMLHLGFRYFIIFIMIDSEPRMQTQHVVFNLLLVYTFMELIKYPYYMLRSFNVNIEVINWIRCTVCFFLYPVAFLFEAIIMFKNLSYFEETERYSLYLPNQLNFSFSLPNFIRSYLLLGLFPFLYLTIVRLYYYRLNVLSRKPIHLYKTD